jgi:hypothetical protein
LPYFSFLFLISMYMFAFDGFLTEMNKSIS